MPTRMPMPAVIQIDAAVVSPRTVRPSRMITPAPRKPMPVMSPCAMRVGSIVPRNTLGRLEPLRLVDADQHQRAPTRARPARGCGSRPGGRGSCAPGPARRPAPGPPAASTAISPSNAPLIVTSHNDRSRVLARRFSRGAGVCPPATMGSIIPPAPVSAPTGKGGRRGVAAAARRGSPCRAAAGGGGGLCRGPAGADAGVRTRAVGHAADRRHAARPRRDVHGTRCGQRARSASATSAATSSSRSTPRTPPRAGITSACR